jgi:hypothetical protein
MAADTAAPAVPSAPPRAPYLQRGDEVDARYETYRARLQRFFEALDSQLDMEAPELRATLVPPAPVPYGYQILPVFAPDPAQPSRQKGVILAAFSWSRTERSIERDGARLDTLEARLGSMDGLNGEIRRRRYLEIVDEYKALVAGQKLIASHIQYNRLWQGEIVRHPGVYERQTSLYHAAVERQALLDALPLGDEYIETELHFRADALARRIDAAIRKLPAADFLRVEHPSPHRWVVHVPMYTDIEDSAFVERVRAAIEHAWHVRDGEDEFSVALDIHRVSPADIYPGGNVPAPGAHIDVVDHIRRFPAGGAVLTTGANITHVRGRSIILGPNRFAAMDFAHEFGHILGFVDGYFRGYRDRGPDGYEVLEVILDPASVMSAPAGWGVERRHFEEVLNEKRAP